MSQHEAWTPDFVASMPFDQLLVWSGSSTGEISQEEAMERIRKKKHAVD